MYICIYVYIYRYVCVCMYMDVGRRRYFSINWTYVKEAYS